MLLLPCHCCGLIQHVPELQACDVAVCNRCHATMLRGGDRRLAASRTAAAAVGALILFWPAVLLPILEIERLGHRHASSILLGSIELLLHGSWFVGLIVLLFSIVFPLTKIFFLLELSWLSLLKRRHKAVTYRIMEHVSKWSMMDVMLLALLVMLVKLGNVVQFHVGPAVIAFVMCVFMSMVASMSFNPHSIWEHEP